MTRLKLTAIILFLSFNLHAQVQILTKTVQNFAAFKNMTYTSTIKDKDFFSENIYNDTINAKISLKGNEMVSFDIKGKNKQEIFYGNKLTELSISDSTYRISNGVKRSSFYAMSFPSIIKRIEKNLEKPSLIKQLNDSIIQNKTYYHLRITELDSIKNNKRIFRFVNILVDKKTHLVYSYREDQQGFIDGTNTFLEHFREYLFYDYRYNQSNFPDISIIQIPTYYTLEKPKKPLPLLAAGTKAPDLILSDPNGDIFKMEDQHKKVVLLNFSLVGCPHCVESIEMVNQLYTKYKSSDLVIVTIYPLDNMESVQKFNNRFNVLYPKYKNPSKGINNAANYHVEGYPAFYLIDKSGNISKGFKGYYSGLDKELNQLIDKLNEI